MRMSCLLLLLAGCTNSSVNPFAEPLNDGSTESGGSMDGGGSLDAPSDQVDGSRGAEAGSDAALCCTVPYGSKGVSTGLCEQGTGFSCTGLGDGGCELGDSGVMGTVAACPICSGSYGSCGAPGIVQAVNCSAPESIGGTGFPEYGIVCLCASGTTCQLGDSGCKASCL